MADLKLPLVFALTAAAAAASLGAETTRKETVYGGHVTLEVADGWHTIPEELLELHSLNTTEITGGRIAELYQHGYRPGELELDFALPQILIQIRESGRLNSRDFLHLPPPEEMKGLPGPLVDDLELDEVFFERDRHLLRLTNLLGAERENMIAVLSASFLTERGLFTLHCYTYATQATVVAPIFEAVVDSVEFDSELRYRPRFGDRWPPRPSTLAYAAAVLIFIALIVVELRRRRRLRP